MSRYIEADATRDLLIKSISLTNGIDTALKEAPSIDIVRCKECKYYDGDDYGEPTRYCVWYESVVNADDFCSYGEREGE